MLVVSVFVRSSKAASAITLMTWRILSSGIIDSAGKIKHFFWVPRLGGFSGTKRVTILLNKFSGHSMMYASSYSYVIAS